MECCILDAVTFRDLLKWGVGKVIQQAAVWEEVGCYVGMVCPIQEPPVSSCLGRGGLLCGHGVTYSGAPYKQLSG